MTTELEEWHDGYDQAIEAGMDESEAVQIADGRVANGWAFYSLKKQQREDYEKKLAQKFGAWH